MEPTSVQIHSTLKRWKINERQISRIVASMAERLDVSRFQVHLRFVGPDAMRRINLQFRNKDKSTDVLTFPQMEWPEPLLTHRQRTQSRVSRNPGMLRGTKKGLVAFEHERMLGDMIICLQAAEKNARQDGHNDVAREVCFLIAHGMLHLCGHDHQNPQEKKLMFAEQEHLMKHQRWKNCVQRLQK